MASLEESFTKVQIDERQPIAPPLNEYKPFMLPRNNSYIVDKIMEYINAQYEHLCQNQIIDIPLPTIPYFDSHRSYFDFINHSEHKFNLLNAYIYAFKRYLRENNIHDPNVNYVNLQMMTPLCRGCNCNSLDKSTCSICVSNYQNFIIRLKPYILKYVRDYPLLDIVDSYPDNDTSDHDLNTYIIEFNQEFNTYIPRVL